MSKLQDEISMSPEVGLTIWRALYQAECSEADLLAAVLIGNGIEPVFEDAKESLAFYREWLIVNGLVEEETETSLH